MLCFSPFLAALWRIEFLGQGSDLSCTVTYAATTASPDPLTHCQVWGLSLRSGPAEMPSVPVGPQRELPFSRCIF